MIMVIFMVMVLGIEDPQIWLAYILCVGSALWCVFYGLKHWNDDD